MNADTLISYTHSSHNYHQHMAVNADKKNKQKFTQKTKKITALDR